MLISLFISTQKSENSQHYHPTSLFSGHPPTTTTCLPPLLRVCGPAPPASRHARNTPLFLFLSFSLLSSPSPISLPLPSARLGCCHLAHAASHVRATGLLSSLGLHHATGNGRSSDPPPMHCPFLIVSSLSEGILHSFPSFFCFEMFMLC